MGGYVVLTQGLRQDVVGVTRKCGLVSFKASGASGISDLKVLPVH